MDWGGGREGRHWEKGIENHEAVKGDGGGERVSVEFPRDPARAGPNATFYVLDSGNVKEKMFPSKTLLLLHLQRSYKACPFNLFSFEVSILFFSFR